MFAVVVIAIIIVLLSGIAWYYFGLVDKASIENEPNKTFVPGGTPLTQEEVINLRSSYLIVDEELNARDFVFNSFISIIDAADNINEIWGLLQNIKSKEEAENRREIIIPANANYIGTKDMLQLKYLLNSDIKDIEFYIYAWNKSYNLNSGKKIEEIHVVWIIDNMYAYLEFDDIGVGSFWGRESGVKGIWGYLVDEI